MKLFVVVVALSTLVFEVTRAQLTVRCTTAGVVCPAGTSCDFITGYCFRQAATQQPSGQTCVGRQCPAGTLCDFNTGLCQAFRQATTAPSTQLCSGVRCPAGTMCNINAGSCQAIGQSCPANSHYETCGTACPLRCYQQQAPIVCTMNCVIGCVCDQFFMQVSATNKTCVRRMDCPSSSNSTQSCGSTVCSPGLKCEGGQCVLRTDCPAVMPGLPQPGCTYESFIDSNGCPMPRLVCPSNQNRGQCGQYVLCQPGLRCENGQCVLRTDCPAVMPGLPQPGCTYESYIDNRGCPLPRLVCPGQNQSQCGSNSVYSTCASACPPTCENRGMAFACNKMCVQGCVCNPGYMFRTSNQTLGCVLESDCPQRDDSGLVCGENEEVKECGACDQYCGRNPRMCTLRCPGGTPQCGCKYGYSRNASGRCVLNSQC